VDDLDHRRVHLAREVNLLDDGLRNYFDPTHTRCLDTR